MLKNTFTLILLFIVSFCQGQSVRFFNNNLQSAITMAQSRGKLIFVDTYAPWCIPCKEMEKVFRDPKLANYFNNTFVNIRIDMDSEHGKSMHNQYQVIFLPTMMILDKDGRVKYKVDRVMSAEDLLEIAQKIAQPEIYSYKPEKQVAVADPSTMIQAVPKKQTVKKIETVRPKSVETPIVKPTKEVQPVEDLALVEEVKKTEPKENIVKSQQKKEEIIEGTVVEEKIIHVFDSNVDDLPPELLKQESYLALQLMDGSHNAAAQKYLETQDDWSTVSNMRFIFDFLYSTDTKEFQHLMNNRAAYEELIGKNKVQRTISILVYDRLDRGFPRPTFEETKDLYAYIGTEEHELLAYEHYMESLFARGLLAQYSSLALEYMDRFSIENDQIYYRLANIYSEDGENFEASLKFIDQAIKINPYNFQYYDTQAYLFYVQGLKAEALASAEKAKSIAAKNGLKTNQIEILIEMIKEDLD